jgi:disulfide bond formation protein DsbB
MRALPVPAATFILSALVIAGFLFFQYGVGLVPCELCLLDRWPWYAAIGISGLALALRQTAGARPVALLLALCFLISTGFGGYHVGVEQHIFAGPGACTASSLSGQSVEELLARLKATPAVRCDVPQWTLFGVSLAGFDLLASLVLLGLCLFGGPREAAGRSPA